MQRSRAFPYLIPSRATAWSFLVQKVEGFGYFVAGKNHSKGNHGCQQNVLKAHKFGQSFVEGSSNDYLLSLEAIEIGI